MTPKKAALYARCSTHEQHPENQIEQLRQVAHQRGWEVVGEYVDRGQSGRKDRRPELDRLMADVHRGKVGLVAVVRFDRWARSVKHLVTSLDDFRCRGVDFISVSDGIDTTSAAGRFSFNVIAAVAQLEADLCRERTRAGLAAARRRGAKIGRPKKWVDVRRARHLLAQGKGYREVARILGVGASTLHRAIQDDERGGVPEPPPSAAPQPPEISSDG